MIACKTSDIVLVRFPFTDLSAAKHRPALVVSPDEYASQYGDAIVLALTSRPQSDDSVAITRSREAGLPKLTWVKPLIATLSASMFTRTIGRLDPVDWPPVRKTIRYLIADHFNDWA